MSEIPKAAIEAAARALYLTDYETGREHSFEQNGADVQDAYRESARSILEAAAGGVTQLESSTVTPSPADSGVLASFTRAAATQCSEQSCTLPSIHTGQHRSAPQVEEHDERCRRQYANQIGVDTCDCWTRSPAQQAEGDVRLTPAQQKVAQHLGERVLDLRPEQRPDIEGLRCYSCGHEFSGRRHQIDTACPECGSDSFTRRRDAMEPATDLDVSPDGATDLASALAEVIWNTSRNDEGTISATGANHLADAVLSSGLVVPVGEVERLRAELAQVTQWHAEVRQECAELRGALARNGDGTSEGDQG